MEVGEVVISEATVTGTGYMEQRPAQPPEDRELQSTDMLTGQTASDDQSMGRSAGRMM
jgi:hypothetical protein